MSRHQFLSLAFIGVAVLLALLVVLDERAAAWWERTKTRSLKWWELCIVFAVWNFAMSGFKPDLWLTVATLIECALIAGAELYVRSRR